MPNERLGCATDIQVFITDQCGAPKICEVTNTDSVAWNRKLDDISTATVTTPLGVGAGGEPCCDCLADIEPWCHELHIFRNGEVVWQGPITKITYGFQKVTIEAKDVLAWLQVRVPQGSLNNAKTSQEITDIALDILKAAFAETGLDHGRSYNADPCVLKFVLQTDLDPVSRRPTAFNKTRVSEVNGFKPFEGTYFDWLQHLSEIGLDYTTVGRRVILAPADDTKLIRLGVLTDDHILGDIELSKDGYQMANRVFMRYEGDTDAANCAAAFAHTNPCPAIQDARFDVSNGFSCYGPIERIFSDASGFDLHTASVAAFYYIRDGNTAARTLDFAGGAKLSQDTPWGINDMVPGQKIDVALSNLCLPVFQSFRLRELDYQLQVGSDEEISLSLAPFNQIGTI